MKSRILMRGKKDDSRLVCLKNIIKRKKRNSLKYWKIKTFSVSSWKCQMIFVFSFQRPNCSKSWDPPNWKHGKQLRSWFVAPPEEMCRPIGDLEQTLFRISIRWDMTALSRPDIGRPAKQSWIGHAVLQEANAAPSKVAQPVIWMVCSEQSWQGCSERVVVCSDIETELHIEASCNSLF